MYKSLIFSVTRYGGAGDWSKCLTEYSYQDKRFLNNLFKKYGSFHLKYMLNTIYKLHIDKLLPEILLSVREAFINLKVSNLDIFAGVVMDKKISIIIRMMITKAFLDFSDKIKQDEDLTNAFEEILEILVEMSYEEAAIVLDEFRIH